MSVIKTEADIVKLVHADEWMMDILETVKSLDLPDCWVCAGFVRSKIWDTLHGFEKRTKLADVDVIYFDQDRLEEKFEKEIESELRNRRPHIPWSVKNQGRMHHINGLPPYLSAEEGISKFPETVTSLGLMLLGNKEVVLTAPHGIEDVVSMEVKPTPLFRPGSDLWEVYLRRVRNKHWKNTWPMVKICLE